MLSTAENAGGNGFLTAEDAENDNRRNPGIASQSFSAPSAVNRWLSPGESILHRKRPLHVSLALAALAVTAGCVYTTESALPAHVRTVRVEMFENRTGYPGLEAELAKSIAREFQVDGRLRPSGAGADSVLKGSIAAVRRSVIQEDKLDDVVTGRVTVKAVIMFEDAVGGEVLLRNELVTSRDALDTEGVFRLRRGETELEGRLSAVNALARNIVRRVIEVW